MAPMVMVGAAEAGEPAETSTRDPGQGALGQGALGEGDLGRSDGLPSDLMGVTAVWEVVTGPSQRAATTVRRLYPDGRLYSWSATRRGADGRRSPAPPRWRLDAKIADVSVIEAVLAEGFFALSPQVPAGRRDGTPRIWRALDSAGTVVEIRSPTGAVPSQVRAVELAIQRGVIPGGVPVEN